MTHDELLAKIDYWFDTDNFHLHKNSLRAVIELHMPQESGGPARCRVDSSHYPCSTIEVIEKELQ